MQAWLLAVIILILSCALGAYYVNDSVSGILEAFFIDSSSIAKKAAELKCETDYQACMDDNTKSNATCTAIYNACNTAAQALDKNVSTVANAPRSPTTLTSAPGALATASGSNEPTAKDIAEWRKILDLRSGSTPYFESANPAYTKLIDLKTKIEKGYNPSAPNLDAAQGRGFFADVGDTINSIKGKLANYNRRDDIIRPHQTPSARDSVITAKNNNATEADDANSMNSIRSQIRNDINAAVKEEMDEIENEYEIVYE